MKYKRHINFMLNLMLAQHKIGAGGGGGGRGSLPYGKYIVYKIFYISYKIIYMLYLISSLAYKITNIAYKMRSNITFKISDLFRKIRYIRYILYQIST